MDLAIMTYVGGVYWWCQYLNSQGHSLFFVSLNSIGKNDPIKPRGSQRRWIRTIKFCYYYYCYCYCYLSPLWTTVLLCPASLKRMYLSLWVGKVEYRKTISLQLDCVSTLPMFTRPWIVVKGHWSRLAGKMEGIVQYYLVAVHPPSCRLLKTPPCWWWMILVRIPKPENTWTSMVRKITRVLTFTLENIYIWRFQFIYGSDKLNALNREKNQTWQSKEGYDGRISSGSVTSQLWSYQDIHNIIRFISKNNNSDRNC